MKNDVILALLVWVPTGAVVSAPLWITMGPPGLLLGLMGPLAVLAFKPGQQIGGKVLVAAIIAVPTVVGVVVLGRRWRRLGTRGRILGVMVVSALWHGTGTAILFLILASFH